MLLFPRQNATREDVHEHWVHGALLAWVRLLKENVQLMKRPTKFRQEPTSFVPQELWCGARGEHA
jgi:hypothetical protein